MSKHSTIRRLARIAALAGGMAMVPFAANASIAHYTDVVQSGTAFHEAQTNDSHVYAGRAGYVSANNGITQADSKAGVTTSRKDEVFLPRVGYVKIRH